MPDPKPKSLMHNLGQFFGHVARGIKAPSGPRAQIHEVRREVEEREEAGPAGERITVRRTTVEEIEVEPAKHPPEGPRP